VRPRRQKLRVTKSSPSACRPITRVACAIELLYSDLVEVEALAVTADEAATMLPPTPSAKHNRILARLSTLVSKTASQACAALERSEELVSLHAIHLAARAAKRSPERRHFSFRGLRGRRAGGAGAW
jgi:hypothetical protein